jgi:exonuclease III
VKVLKLATVNLNGLYTRARVEILHDFIRAHEIDIVYLQEAPHPSLGEILGYTTYSNEGTEMRGTAFVFREELQLTNITKLPSGRGMAAIFRGILLIKIYIPSGATKSQEREYFYIGEQVYLLRDAPVNILLGGGFNCVLDRADTAGHYNYIRALAGLIKGFELKDVWQKHPARRVYTHYMG